MFCKQCGTENTEGAAFCKNCGINLSAPVQPTPVYDAPAPAPQVKAPLSTNPVLNAVKKVASSPLFLIAVIAFTIEILAAIVGSTSVGAKVQMFLYELLDRFGGATPYEFYDAVDSISRMGNGTFVAGTIIGLIPKILICVGLWLTYGSAVSRSSDTMKTSGLTMVKGLTIVQLVFTCIGFALVELLLLLLVIAVGAADVYQAEVIIAALVVLILVAAAVFVLGIIYLSKIIKSVNTAKYTIETAVASDKVSSFVAVFAFFGVIGALLSIGTSFISSIATMTELICFGIIIFKYKSAMKALMYQQRIL